MPQCRDLVHAALGKLALMATAALRPARAQGAPVLRFSPVNQYGIERTAGYWNPIIAYESARSGGRLWRSEPLHDLALMASRKVYARDLQAVSRAFLDMARDPEGRQVPARACGRVKLPPGTAFVPSKGLEYGACRRFYQSTPVHLR